jgi:putative ABC transport system permease protein
VREIVHALAPSLPVFGVETLSQEVKASLWRERLMAVLSSAFGLLAALLAGIGLYGVVAYSTTKRIREIGVRIALGAQRGDVLSMVVAQGLKLALIGVAVGMAATLGLARLLASMLYGVTPSDPTRRAAGTRWSRRLVLSSKQRVPSPKHFLQFIIENFGPCL